MMDSRHNELFVLDAEQAVKEIAQFGSGQTELQTRRVIATVDYLDSVLQSVGLTRHASFCREFAKAFPALDEGQGRRLARDFVALAQAQFEAIRAQDSLPDDQEALGRLLAKLPQPRGNEPAASVLPNGRFFQDAARAMAAVDELAHRIQAGLERSKLDDTVLLGGERSALSDASMQTVEESADVALGHSPSTIEALEPLASDQPFSHELVAAESKRTLDCDDAAETSEALYSGAKIDQAFRRALKLTDSGPWLTGVGALLESVDDLDHLPLSLITTTHFTWAAGATIRVQAQLVLALAQAMRHQRLQGMGDAILVAHTLILAVQLESPVPSEPFAKLAGHFGGRLESDLEALRMRFVIPASARLLRIVPLVVEGRWVAVPWAQFLNAELEQAANPLNLRQHALDQSASRLSVRLCIGDEADRMISTEMGQVSVGVRFEIPQHLRRRERYRGIVLTPDGLHFPVYG